MSLRAWWQVVQPHSFPASMVPVAPGATVIFFGLAQIVTYGVAALGFGPRL